MLKFNTQAKIFYRFQHSLLRVFKAAPPLPSALRTGLLMALLISGLSSQSLFGQCDIVCPGNPDYDLSLNVMGQATLDETVFEPLVSSSYTQCLPANGGVLEVWENNAATIPYKTALPGPNFNCNSVGTTFTVYVTLNDPGPGTQSPTCQFNVRIVDNVVPIIFPPSNLTVNTDPGPSCASVQTVTATVVDNCGGNLVLSHTLSGATTGTFPGFSGTHAFNQGVTTITWTVEDLNGTLPSVFYTANSTVTVNDNQNPTFAMAPPVGPIMLNANASCEANYGFDIPTPSDNCGIFNYTLELTGAVNLGPVPAFPGNFALNYPLGTTTVTLEITDFSGLTTSHSFDIVVEDNTAPVFAPATPVSGTVSAVNCNGSVNINLSSFISDNCSAFVDIDKTFTITSPTMSTPPFTSGNGFSVVGSFPTGTYNITFRAEDESGNVKTHLFVLTVIETTPPTAVCDNITVNLDVNGERTVDAIEVDGGSTDNCGVVMWRIAPDNNMNGIPDVPFTDDLDYDCSDKGTHTVLLEVKDAAGNSDTCSATITVEDNMAPTAQCKDIIDTLNITPMDPDTAVVYAIELNNMSYDNCPGMLTFEVSRAFGGPYADSVIFNCADVAPPARTVYLRVTDVENNTNICTATVTVRDVTPPVAVCQDYMASLSGSGTVTVSASAINDGSTDNCSINMVRIAPDANNDGLPDIPFANSYVYDCDDVGMNTALLEVKDPSGNADTCSATVTIDDDLKPTAVCPASPIDVFINQNGVATAFANVVGANSTDNCDIDFYRIQRVNGMGTPVGSFNASLNYGCNQCNNTRTVRLYVQDVNGNISDTVTCMDAIRIVDDINPTAGCTNNLAIGLGSNGEANVTSLQLALLSSDNCTGILGLLREIHVDSDNDGILDAWQQDTVFNCTDIGLNTVRVRVTDDCGNSSICIAEVTVQDNEDPTLTCPDDITVECTSPDPANQNIDPSVTGDVLIAPAIPMGGDGLADDNCEVTVTYADGAPVFSPDCQAAGQIKYAVSRTWTAEDGEGNTTSCTQIIRVQDTTAPTFTAPGDIHLDCPDSYDVANRVCTTLTSTDVPVLISDVGTPTVTSQGIPAVPVNGKILDVNVNVFISHNWIGDLDVQLEYYAAGDVPGIDPPTQVVPLFEDLCDIFPGFKDLNMTLDDDGALIDGVTPDTYGNIPCPPTDQLVYNTISSDLSFFNGLLINGTWLLRISDDFPSFDGGGQLNAWSLDICYVPQEGELALTGDVTDEADNCDMPDATYMDYHAFKDFQSNTAYIPDPLTYNFSPGQWTSTIDPPAVPPALPLLDLSNTPASITMRSHDDGSGVAKENLLEISIPAMGWVIFDWDYLSLNSDPMYDPFGYLINGVLTQLVENGGPLVQSGRAVVPVMAGQTFGFFQNSLDSQLGQATTVISNFVYVDKLICPVPDIDCPREFCVARMWDLQDDCGNSALSQAQIITTGDDDAPLVDGANFPQNVTIITPSGICSPNVNLDIDPWLSDGGCTDPADLEVSNDALAKYGVGDGERDASGFYSPGTYTIEFTIEDECGNVNNYTVTLNVVDDQDPDAKCKDFVVQLNNNGEATVLLTDLDNGSLDNCPGLTLSFSAPPAAPVSSLLFTTQDVGLNPITLYAVDASGNSSSCVSIVTVLGGVLFDAADASGQSGNTVPVIVTTNNEFYDIGSFSLTMEITDGTVANTVAGGVAIHPDLAALGGLFSFNIVSSTELTVSWVSPSPFGSTLVPPNTGLFTVTADLVGAAGTSTPITIDNDVANRIIAGISVPVPSLGLAGTISILNQGANFTIAGTLQRDPAAPCNSDDIEMVDVLLSGSPSMPASPILNAAGSYSYDVPQGSSPTITPVKDDAAGWFNGVTIFDVLAVNQHFLGIPPLLDSPYKILAADANNNNAIDIADVFAINQLSLNNLPNGLGTSWEFVDADHVFTNPMNPWTAPIPHTITVNNVQNDVLDADFIGYKIGDVDCDGDPTQLLNNAGDDRNGKLPFAVSDRALNPGEEFAVTFRAKDFSDLVGYQTTVSFDPARIEFVEFIPAGNLTNLTTSNVNANMASHGQLATNWFNIEPVDLADGDAIFTVRFKALQKGLLSEMLDLTSGMIASVAVKADGGARGIDLVFESTTSTEELSGGAFALYQNQPNPFGFRTTIGFNLPASTDATLTITDAAGKVLKVIDAYYSAGYHQVFIDRSELAANGMLFYKLETPTHTAVRKMILMN